MLTSSSSSASGSDSTLTSGMGGLSESSAISSEFALEKISISTIVEKLISERLKLGIVKMVKVMDQPVEFSSVSMEPEKTSDEEEISSLKICLNKFERNVEKALSGLELDSEEPEENPINVIEPDFSSSESEADYKNPDLDDHMLLNRTRSFYTPKGFKDPRPELKRLETERGKMWKEQGRSRYLTFLYEEAVRPLNHLKIKGVLDGVQDSDDDEDDELPIKEDVTCKSIESLIDLVKPDELSPQEWDPGSLNNVKNPPYWAIATPEATNKTINTIRYLYKSFKGIDFSKKDPRQRRPTGRRFKAALSISIDESESSSQTKEEEPESEDEPYLLRRKDSAFIKKKVVEEVIEEEEEFELVICPALHNIQQGHELSISTLHKQYPDSPEIASPVDSEPEIKQETFEKEPSIDDDLSQESIEPTLIRSLPETRQSWLLEAEFEEEYTSEESLYDTLLQPESIPEDRHWSPPLAYIKGFPVIKQRPKWITLERECSAKDPKDMKEVELYKCLCSSRGIPPLEAIARNAKKKSAVFNRMGQGPEQTIQTLSEILGNQTKLLDLTGYYLNDSDVCYLGTLLERLSLLTRLRLARTKLTKDIFESLVPSLTQSHVLCYLDVSYNSLKKLSANTSRSLPLVLTSINLSHCELGTDSFPGLCSLSPFVKSLDISWNRLNDINGLKNFSTSLVKRESAMRELRMGWNSLEGPDVVKVLVDLVKSLTKLNYLDLSANGFGSVEEMVLFNDMIQSSETLRCFLLAGNPLVKGADEALLKELSWITRPSLRLIDLGDIWIEKPVYQICKQYLDDYGLEVRVGGIKGNVDLTNLDLGTKYMRRIHFLNTPKKKKKKNTKDLGNAIKKLLDATIEEGSGPQVKASKLRTAIEDDKLKLEEGLIEAFLKHNQDKSKMIDLEQLLAKYRYMFPEEPKVEKKKPTKKRKQEELDIPTVEIMEPKLTMTPSKLNLYFLEPETNFIPMYPRFVYEE